jgi:hypothetical protein
VQKKLSYSYKIFSIFITSCIILFCTCEKKNDKDEANFQRATKVLLAWNNAILELERHTPGYRPPVSARMLAYIQVCAYETSIPAIKEYKSLKESFLPQNDVVRPENYSLPIALNAAYAQIIRYFFATAPISQANELAQIEKQLFEKNQPFADEITQKQSITFGKAMADAIWEYSKTDSIGHEGNLYNYDKNYIPPNCKGCWQPCGEYLVPALLPYWAKARTFIVHKNEIAVRPPLTFDETRNSSFYTEAMEVFLTAQNRTHENIWVSEFWSDDLPELTVTPVGRWFSISNQFISENEFSFPKIMESYLKLGIALNDASVICWNAKYQFNVERPESYIRRNIEPNWKPLHDSPSFPAYPSGHSTFGATSTEILKAILGDTQKLTDRTHRTRTEFKGNPRTYYSFDEMVKENAFSRLSMGVHYRMDCEEGLRMGKVIGKKVAQFNIKK